jgi:hypothetical protein
MFMDASEEIIASIFLVFCLFGYPEEAILDPETS